MDLLRYSPPTDSEESATVRPRNEQTVIRKVSYAREYGNAIGAALGHGAVDAMVTAGDTHTVGFRQTNNSSEEWCGFTSSEPTCLAQAHSELL